MGVYWGRCLRSLILAPGFSVCVSPHICVDVFISKLPGPELFVTATITYCEPPLAGFSFTGAVFLFNRSITQRSQVMNLSFFSGRRLLSSALSAVMTIGALLVSADSLNAQIRITHDPVIGSSDPVSGEPRVPRLDTPHCTVNLFSNLEFADFNTKNFTYTPPPGCAGPYAKIIFAADFTVTAGRQYDRTAQFYIGGANIFFGTTAEPRAKLSPSWHVENDVTDLSAIFSTPQAGTALLGNYIGVYDGVDYNGIIYSSAHLVFYPVTNQNTAAKVPDVVIGIPGNGGAGTLNSTSSVITQAVTLPTNTEAIYLDVIAQSQSNDEFWYLCVPNNLAAELESCGSTGFRETEVTVDGVPAGVAPVYPWIYTGGIDPYLWEPITGVQTLNFKPFRVDLTPFASRLASGKPHTVGISVFNADSYFAAEGNLLVYTDKGSKQTTGELMTDTLTLKPREAIDNKIVTDSSGDVSGSVTVSSSREFHIVGKLRTSHGEVTTAVNGKYDFSNKQTFIIDETEYKQYVQQSTEGGISVVTTENGVSKVGGQAISYPFSFDYDEVANEDGTYTVHNISDQNYVSVSTNYGPGQGAPPFGPHASDALFITGTGDQVKSSDDLYFDASFNLTGHAGSSSENYVQADSTGYCFSRMLAAKDSVLTGYKDGGVCKELGDVKATR